MIYSGYFQYMCSGEADLCRHADSFSAPNAEFGGKFRGLRLDDRRTPGLRFSLYHRHVGARADGSVRAILLKREG
jgi:hypothetical protein